MPLPGSNRQLKEYKSRVGLSLQVKRPEQCYWHGGYKGYV